MAMMLIKMSVVTLLHVVLTYILWIRYRDRRIGPAARVLIGVIFGLTAVLSTHFGVNYEHMMLNVRDLGPLSAGLFFNPVAGVIAGLIGGIERYLAGTYLGIGSYTRVACAVSTCLAGVLAAVLRVLVFKGRRISPVYGFFVGAVMEVFHMYVVFLTHRDDMHMAFYVVQTCAFPMIVFNGIGMALSSIALMWRDGELRDLFRWRAPSEVRVSTRFQVWLFIVAVAILVMNFVFSYTVQTQAVEQDARDDLLLSSTDIQGTLTRLRGLGIVPDLRYFHVGRQGTLDIVGRGGQVLAGAHVGAILTEQERELIEGKASGPAFSSALFGESAFCRSDVLDSGEYLLLRLPDSEVYENRDAGAYETFLADILIFAAIYLLISQLVQGIVVNNLERVNASLDKIARGNLEEEVSVYTSYEFAVLSRDINHTVEVLKGYIAEAGRRNEQEMEFARVIQRSSLPSNFTFPRDDLEIYAMMDPARGVGGDFYDFFFLDSNRLALVIADVSGKGIPAALFMMRGKSTIRSAAQEGKSPSQILAKVNETLCDGNVADMFITAWVGVVDLGSGRMVCANAGHEYPVLRRSGGSYALYKDPHAPAVATMEGLKFKEYEMSIREGDEIFLYTDGVPEAINEAEEDFGTGRLLDVLNAHRGEPLSELLPAVRQCVQGFVGGAAQFDDITMLGFRYLGRKHEE